MLFCRHRIEVMATAMAALAIGSPRAILAGENQPSRPNLLFIMSDDHAAHAVSAYGSRINRTPNLDRIAAGGIRFDHCFCTNSLCAPSRAVILTGKYSHRNGIVDNGHVFDGARQTFPKLLRQAGYETAIVGKWHLGSAPTGFDYWNILPGQGAYHDPAMIEGGVKRKCPGYVTDVITDKALDWLKHRRADKPFCLMIHHKAPHANWEPDARHAAMYSDADIPMPETFDDDYATRSAHIRDHRLHVGPKQWELHFLRRFGPIPGGMTEQEARRWVYQRFIKDYLRCVASVDDNVGRVLDYLDRSGLSGSTVVLYTSDQGFFLGDHGLYDKRLMYEHSLRMPLLVRYPKEIKPGMTAGALVLNLDFAPTLLDYAGAPIPADMQGRSFRAVARGEKPADWRAAVYYRFYENAYGVGPHEGVRAGRYKLIHYLYGEEAWELFDLEQDPNELNNLYRSADHAGVARDLQGRMNALKKQYAVPAEK